MNTLYVFTEEPSLKNVLEILLPKLLPNNYSYRVFSHQGKQDLENAIEKTIPTLSKIPGAKILVTRDQDNEDCKQLKNNILEKLNDNCSSTYLVRIVCRELESWFLGDMIAIENTYNRFKSEQHVNKKLYRDVDSIKYPNKELLKLIPEYNGRSKLPKLEVSEKISTHLSLERNTSTSFKFFIEGVRKLTSD